MEKPRLQHAAHPKAKKASEHLNVVGYDRQYEAEMPSSYRRNITPEYVKGLIGAPYMWDHINGELPGLAAKHRTTHELMRQVSSRKDKIGTVVDAFSNGRKLYASVKLREGATIPPSVARYLENSITDICWDPRNGKVEPVELSATTKGLRKGCVVVGQEDPASFRRRITMADFASMPADKKAVWDSALKAIAESDSMKALMSAGIDPAQLDAYGTDFKSNVVAALTGALSLKSMKDQPQQATPAAAAAPGANPYRAMAQNVVLQKFGAEGVPDEIGRAFVEGPGFDHYDAVAPVIASASAAAFRRGLEAAKAAGYSSDLPEPPTNKRKMEPSSEHTASDHLRRLAENNSRVQNYFPGL